MVLPFMCGMFNKVFFCVTVVWEGIHPSPSNV